jgi:CheY-like chemotaxis protein
VVEDDPVIANLLKCLLMDEAEVVLAQDGVTGLDFIRDGHFNVVVSDVEMPNLDGIALYRQALEIDPDLKRQFVFFSGTRKPEHHKFFQSENLVLLPKPSPMGRLRKVIYEVADAEG